MKNLPTWKKPIAWTIIALALPLVGAWRSYRRACRIVWAGRMFESGGPFSG